MTRCTYDPAVKSAYVQARKHLVFRLGDKQTSMQRFALTPFKTLPSTAIYQTATFPGLLQHHEQPPARWVHRQAQKRPFFELSGGLILPKHRSTPSQKKDRQECHDEREPSASRAAPEPGNLAAQLPHHLPQIASSTILFQGEALDVFAELFFGVEHADEHADSGGDAAVDDRVVEKHMCGLRNVVDCLDCHEVRPEPGAGFF